MTARRPARSATSAAAIGFFVLVALLAAGCVAPARVATAAEIGLGARVEQVRAHLGAAAENARAGGWELAAVHVAHPAEDMPAVDRVLGPRDAAADAALRDRLGEAARSVGSRDLSTLEALVGDVDRRLALVPAAVMGDARAAEPQFRASVLAALVEASAGDYGEAFIDGALRNEVEYQDAAAFLRRALALWSEIDAPLAQRTPEAHRAVSAGLGELRRAMPGLRPPAAPVPAPEVDALALTVRDTLRAAAGARAADAVIEGTSTTVAAVDAQLDRSLAALDAGDPAAASAAVEAFRTGWTDVESPVRARSPSAYGAIENDTARALSLLGQRPPDARAARDAVARIREQLAPFVAVPPSYGVFDAAIILFREGFEALLVVAALLMFLTRTGNADKRRWIWGGGAAGVLSSVGVAALVTVAFSASTAAGTDRELLEGITGLVAAAMLVYVSYWLHSKSSLSSWERYIRERSTSALARNSLLSLALISFLAVFREGAETALFYLGIAPSIALNDLALGLALGTAGLVAIGVLMLVFGLRIPIRPFFLVTSLLVYYLAFKFVGTGIHALQVAGVAPATSRGYLPDLGFFGVFPTWETTIVQAALLAAALALALVERAHAVRGSGGVAAA